jgi:hypothetical protein
MSHRLVRETFELVQAWLKLSMAKYAMGMPAFSEASYREYPITTVRVTATQAQASLHELCLTTGGKDDRAKQLRAFGGIVSPHLREAQQDFLDALQCAVQCSNAHRKLDAALGALEQCFSES